MLTVPGPHVLHQVPDGSITPSTAPSALPKPLFNFHSVADYIIPKEDFCDRLVTICTNHCRIIGYCVRIYDDAKYEKKRNLFIFNMALVLDEDMSDWASYASVVKKLGRMLRGLEEQGDFLSNEEDPSWYLEHDKLDLNHTGQDGQDVDSDVPESFLTGTGGKVYALCEMVLEDLNNYRECMIPIDDANTINLKVFPTLSPPAPVQAWHVPLLTVDLDSFSSPQISSDLTMMRVLPLIDGVKSVYHIAEEADADLGLTRKAIQHLVYYGCVLLLDLFQFSASYAPTAEIGAFVIDEEMQEECLRYVRVPRSTDIYDGVEQPRAEETRLATSSINHSQQPPKETTYENGLKVIIRSDGEEIMRFPDPTKETLVRLYTSLRQGYSVKNFMLDHVVDVIRIDLRRFITFGVIKGFLYRVHKYAIWTGISANFHEHDGLDTNPTSSSTAQTHLPLAKYLDGKHCFDQLRIELDMTEEEILKKVKEFGNVQIIQR